MIHLPFTTQPWNLPGLQFYNQITELLIKYSFFVSAIHNLEKPWE